MHGCAGMFEEARRFRKKPTMAMLSCNTGSDDWDGMFTVNYNLDNETGFDDDVASSTYGNYQNHWCEPCCSI